MLVCNYCGRNLKNHYETCPGCGSSSFKEKASLGEIIIKTPPKDGYHVNMDSLKKTKTVANVFNWIGIIFLITEILFFIPFFIVPFLTTDANVEGASAASFDIMWIAITIAMFIPAILIPLAFILGAKSFKKKAAKEMERIEKLSKKGLLVKNLPYEKQKTGTVINGQEIYALKVYYENEKGNKVPLVSNAKYDNRVDNPSGTADLLIDPDDFSNYYIDLEIY